MKAAFGLCWPAFCFISLKASLVRGLTGEIKMKVRQGQHITSLSLFEAILTAVVVSTAALGSIMVMSESLVAETPSSSQEITRIADTDAIEKVPFDL